MSKEMIEAHSALAKKYAEALAALAQAALELGEAGEIIGKRLPATGMLFTRAAAVANKAAGIRAFTAEQSSAG